LQNLEIESKENDYETFVVVVHARRTEKPNKVEYELDRNK
jgi:hypothetical protein